MCCCVCVFSLANMFLLLSLRVRLSVCLHSFTSLLVSVHPLVCVSACVRVVNVWLYNVLCRLYKNLDKCVETGPTHRDPPQSPAVISPPRQRRNAKTLVFIQPLRMIDSLLFSLPLILDFGLRSMHIPTLELTVCAYLNLWRGLASPQRPLKSF